jgi:hypothetical protein
LHRGAFCCGSELGQGLETDKYVTFCLDRVELLRKNGVKPLLVFDGATHPLKRELCAERRRQRDGSQALAREALANGNRAAAQHLFNKAIVVTHEMVTTLVAALRERAVDYVIAPYEADAQVQRRGSPWRRTEKRPWVASQDLPSSCCGGACVASRALASRRPRAPRARVAPRAHVSCCPRRALARARACRGARARRVMCALVVARALVA